MKKLLLIIALILLLVGTFTYYTMVYIVDLDCLNVGGHWVTEGNQRICDVK